MDVQRTWWAVPMGRKHYVKNLSWLHRHASEAYTITYFAPSGVMLAHMEGGRYYRTQWNSQVLFTAWYARRFAHLPLIHHEASPS